MSKRNFVLILLGVLVLKVFMAVTVPLTPDEGLHWMQGRHLAWGFTDHPPGTAFLNHVGTAIFGVSLLGIRIFPLLSTTVCSLIAVAILRELGVDDDRARKGAIYLQMMPIMLFGLLMVPVFPFAAIILLAEYFFLRALRSGRILDHLMWGVLLGLATLIYYMSATAIVAVILFCLTNRKGRALFAHPGFWLGAAVSAIVILPNVLWNLGQGEQSAVAFQLAERSPYQFAPANTLSYIIASLVIAGPLLIPALKRSIQSIGADREEDGRYFLSMAVLAPFAAFLLLSPFREVGAHWTIVCLMNAPLYLIVNSKRSRSAVVGTAISLAIAALAIVILLAGIERSARFLDPQGKMISERKLSLLLEASKAGKAAHDSRVSAAETKETVGFAADKWGYAGLLSFHTPGNPYYHLYPSPTRHGRDYSQWNKRHDPGAATVFVSTRKELRDEVARSCREVEPLHDDFEKFPPAYGLYLCKGLDLAWELNDGSR